MSPTVRAAPATVNLDSTINHRQRPSAVLRGCEDDRPVPGSIVGGGERRRVELSRCIGVAMNDLHIED
jgi:ABC-type lipopolysaccharide export system ATPase subunit